METIKTGILILKMGLILSTFVLQFIDEDLRPPLLCLWLALLLEQVSNFL